MKSGRSKLALGAALIVAVIALFLILKPGDSDDGSPPAPVVSSSTGSTGVNGQDKVEKPKPPPVPTVIFRDGEPEDGVLKIDVKEGDQIRFNVKSDVPEEVHVHGYDISQDVAAGGTAKLDFKAEITGIFEAEMERSGIPIVELQINP